MSQQGTHPTWSNDLIQENMRLKRINQNLKVNLNRLRARFESMETLAAHVPQNVWWIDDTGVLLFVNDAFFEEACQYSHRYVNEIIGKNFYDLAYELGLSRYEISAMKKHDALVLETEVPAVQEQKMTLMGKTGVYLTYKKAVRDHCQKRCGLIVLAIDISELKQQEAVLQASMQMVETAHLEKLRFLENVRHDLRSPLSNIIAAADLIKNMLKDENMREFLEAIIASGNHVMELFAQLIDFFQTKHQKQPNRIQSIEVQQLISDVAHSMRMHSHNRPIEFDVVLDSKVPGIILSDRIKLSRILSNLLGNAFKYTENGRVGLVVNYDEHSEKLWIEVSDSGIGIAKDDLDRIFEPLVRLHDLNTGDYEGLGLGLSIVDQFVRDLNGNIQVRSEVGTGSVFRLGIPASRERVIQPAPQPCEA